MIADEPSPERQMGCMAGFFHLFDRNYISSKRYVSPKSLHLPSQDTECISAPDRSHSSSTFFPEQSPKLTPSPKEKPWRFLESSRLSLDSRAVTDAKGKFHQRSPGAVARLMGLDALPGQNSVPKPAILRRSSSESRAHTELSFYHFVDATAFEKVPIQANIKKQRNDSLLQRKGFELYPPEPKWLGVPPVPVSLYCDVGRRLRVRGIEETRKQVLEAVQLRGLLHSKPLDGPDPRMSGYDRSSIPVVLMKPDAKSSRSPRRYSRSEKRDPNAVRCTDRSRRVLNSEVRRGTERMISPVRSPAGSPRKVGPGLGAVRSGMNNQRRDANVVRRGISTGTGTGSAKCITSPSQYDGEVDERTGRSLLERCDQLVYSIAAMTAADQITGEDLQPSPVSVLDTVFHGEEESPSPDMKRTLHFQASQAFERARAAHCTGSPSSTPCSQMSDIGNVWQEIQQIREPIIANEVTDVTCSMKDMAADHAWSRQSAELSEAVLQIERLIFKDLVADVISELADGVGVAYHLPRRKLVF